MENRLKNINSFWGYLLIDELVRNDITYFCISPGSRSTPLTIAAAENKNAEKFICIDERAAAVEMDKDKFGDTFIVLPNPIYGNWEAAVYGGGKWYKKSAKERSDIRVETLRKFKFSK